MYTVYVYNIRRTVKIFNLYLIKMMPQDWKLCLLRIPRGYSSTHRCVTRWFWFRDSIKSSTRKCSTNRIRYVVVVECICILSGLLHASNSWNNEHTASGFRVVRGKTEQPNLHNRFPDSVLPWWIGMPIQTYSGTWTAKWNTLPSTLWVVVKSEEWVKIKMGFSMRNKYLPS